MRLLHVSLYLIATLSIVGCEVPADPATVRGKIQAQVRKFADAAQTDVSAMLAMYEQGAGTVSISNGQIERGIEAIRKKADTNLVGNQGTYKIDLGSIEVVSAGNGFALSVTPFVISDQPSVAFSKPSKGVSTIAWKKTADGWKVIQEHESYQP